MKQVIVVDESLKLPRGKLAAQVAHAALDGFLNASTEAKETWLAVGMPKLVLRVHSTVELMELAVRAQAAGLPFALIQDAGRSVVPDGTTTCIAIGPAQSDEINLLTGELRLMR